MKEKTEALISDLIERTRINMNDVEKLKKYSAEALNWKASAESWSVLECMEHLNLYGDFYLPEFESRISKSKYDSVPEFKSGILGNYFAKSMLPRKKLNKMKTFKDKNPIGSDLSVTTINRFVEQQKLILDLLDKAGKVDLNKTKSSISISKYIKLKLGDAFRVVIYHNQRHIVQAQNVIKKYKEAKSFKPESVAQ